MLFFLMALFALALALSLLGAIPQSPRPLLFHAVLLLAVCWLSNLAFAWAFRAESHTESVLISAFILMLISSASTPTSFADLEFPLFAGIWAMSSKYLFAVRRQPIFNPAAFGIFCASFLTTTAANWWIGNIWSLGVVLAGGCLLLRKMRCFDLVISFCGTVLLVSTLLAPAGYVWTFELGNRGAIRVAVLYLRHAHRAAHPAHRAKLANSFRHARRSSIRPGDAFRSIAVFAGECPLGGESSCRNSQMAEAEAAGAAKRRIIRPQRGSVVGLDPALLLQKHCEGMVAGSAPKIRRNPPKAAASI